MKLDRHTFIIAPRLPVARSKATELGVPPHGRTTHLISHPDALRGYSIRPTDDVHVVPEGARLPSEMRDALDLARMAGGSA